MKKFKTSDEMDRALEQDDLSGEFAAKGVVKKPHIKKINLDLPEEVIQRIDRIAEKVGVSRQPLLKIWIHERLKAENE
ncbi:MAG: CopG family transcriptional regulator [Deltaproteobacteria bacterium]|nr:CopG family transcriptional regulator [Deltaproteobacteria bacterium]